MLPGYCKVLPIQLHWAQSIYYLGTWTLRVIELHKADPEPFEAKAVSCAGFWNLEGYSEHA